MRCKDKTERQGYFGTICYTLCTILFFMALSDVCFAGSAQRSVKKGNSFYQKGKYDEALKYYNEAALDEPDSEVVNFNIGTALYRKQDYERAIETFNKALLSDNPDIEQKAAYNIGNCKFRLGKLKENTDIAAAVNFYRQALDYYKRAIELNQDNADAKYNHEFVERELKILLDKLKQQQQKQDKRQRQEQGQRQQQETAAGISRHEQQEQKRKEQEQKEGQQQKEQAEEQRQAGASQVEESDEKESEGKGGAEEAEVFPFREDSQEGMSEEEARMILDRYSQEDMSVGNLRKQKTGGYYPPVLRDW